jgi:phytanoyl-CoA hydroxylase
MGTNLEKMDLDMQFMKDKYFDNGYVLLKDFLDKEIIEKILQDAKSIFQLQFDYLNLDSNFNENLKTLFKNHFQVFIDCGKQIQHLISLHKLSLDDNILTLINSLGIEKPNISTRPVLYFNHPELAKEKSYHTVDAHQDWRSMQSSLDSLVIWIPLTDIDKSLGALQIIPKSHLLGLKTIGVVNGFGMVDTDIYDDEFIDVEVKQGDILVFSSFLIHRSGNNSSGQPRWSCHFRYNNLKESTFIKRGFPHNYIYKPEPELITKNFPGIEDLKNIFK